ncbi:STM3941 family protein [Sphingomonas sp.]|uniref:STM3941 family protein n=1 Tax=Sphingomonas sp. TaxID=28214 RepID=UPI00345BD1BA
MTAFEARNSPWRLVLLFMISLAFVFCGCILTGLIGRDWGDSLGQPRLDPDEARPVGWVVLIFFGACSLAVIRRLTQSGVELRIGVDGIYWRRWSDQTIPWTAIERVTTGSVHGQRFACLFLRNPAAFPSTGLVGKLAAINKSIGFGDIALSTTGTDRSFQAMMAAIAAFAPAGLLA